jgi:hypothetical protein
LSYLVPAIVTPERREGSRSWSREARPDVRNACKCGVCSLPKKIPSNDHVAVLDFKVAHGRELSPECSAVRKVSPA